MLGLDNRRTHHYATRFLTLSLFSNKSLTGSIGRVEISNIGPTDNILRYMVGSSFSEGREEGIHVRYGFLSER
jgi:hypothetical protein